MLPIRSSLSQICWICLLITVLFGWLLCACSSDEDEPPASDDAVEVEIVELETSNELRSQIATEVAETVSDSIDTYLSWVTPVRLPSPDSQTSTLLDNEIGRFDFAFAEISDAALAQRPFEPEAEDLRFFVVDETEGPAPTPMAVGRGSTEGDPELKTAIGQLIDRIAATGLQAGQLRNAWSSTLFHDEANFPGGLPDGTTDGATFTWDGSVFWNAAWRRGGIFFWADGFNHMVLASRHVTALKSRDFVGAEFELSSSAETALHELGHVLMSRTLCAEDDPEDQMAAVLERVIANRVEMELARSSQGAPLAASVQTYSDQVAQLVEIGGTNCLRDLGWGLPAEEITVDVPSSVRTGESFDAEFTVRRIGGEPATADWAWTWVETEIQALQLDGGGSVRRSITAPEERGEIRIFVKSLGQEVRTSVKVGEDTSGACCTPGDCSVVPTGTCAGEYQGDGTVCDPNPCPEVGACCLVGVCTIIQARLCAGDFQGVDVSCDPYPCDYGACCLPDGECRITAEAECMGNWAGPQRTCENPPCPTLGACCWQGGCNLQTRQYCEEKVDGSLYLGEGLHCLPDPCDGPAVGACCLAGGDRICVQSTRQDCVGTYLGDKVPCTPEPCGYPGACCVGADCRVVIEAACNGSFEGEDTSCEPNPCEGLAPCCLANGACELKPLDECLEADGLFFPGLQCEPISPCSDLGACCSGEDCELRLPNFCFDLFLGAGSVCEPNSCGDSGACCLPAGFCEVDTQTACDDAAGTFFPRVSCSPLSPCLDLGACCAGATCVMVSEEFCLETYLGAGSVCEPNPCAVGACCAGASCFITTAFGCDGVYLGDATVCDPGGVCPSGACCSFEGCEILVANECVHFYAGNGTLCNPDSCSGACCFGDECELGTVAECVEAAGIHKGPGTDCEPNPCP